VLVRIIFQALDEASGNKVAQTRKTTPVQSPGSKGKQTVKLGHSSVLCFQQSVKHRATPNRICSFSSDLKSMKRKTLRTAHYSITYREEERIKTGLSSPRKSTAYLTVRYFTLGS
jgi:hypothetical protein